MELEIVEIAAGVYAVMASDGSAALSNAGIVDLGDRTLVFDTLGTAVGGEALREEAERLTGRVATVVVNSHAHFDHWCGNQAFASEAQIIAATEARQAMQRLEPGLRATIDDPSPLADQLRAFRERLADETDPRWRATLERAIPRLELQLAALLMLEPVLPSLSFQSELVLHGASRTAVLRNRGPGHSESDSYLVLPDDGIVFLGDLAFVGSQPLLAAGHVGAWSALIGELCGADHQRIVPGHGPLGTTGDLELQREYLAALEGMVAQVLGQGGAVEDALLQSPPPPFEDWVATDMIRFEQNVRNLFRSLAGESAEGDS